MPFNGRVIPASGQFDSFVLRDGWSLRRYRQAESGKAQGSILWLGGRGDIVEKYFEAIDGWARNGWQVTSFDWRGQGGSGRISRNALVGHISDFAIWIDDLAEFYGSWSRDNPGPHVIMGHSMGGHLVLRALAEQRIAPDKAVLIAPMLGFSTPGLPFWLAKRFAALMAWLSDEMRPAWKRNERPSPANASRQSYLTHDDRRYADEMWWKEQDPSLPLGPPSWGWMAAAYRSIARLNIPGMVEQVKTPVLILNAEHDQLVDPAANRRFGERLPAAEFMLFGDESAHEILREADPVRERALAAIKRFLED